MNIDVKQNDSGFWFYSFAIEKGSRPTDVLSAVTDESATTSAISIPQPAENVNPQPQGADDGTRYALDSEGRELSPAQAEYFADSKVRDEDGNLLVMYHGTEKTENPRGQRVITDDDIVNIPTVIQSPDLIKLSKTPYNGKPVINFVKRIDGSRITVTAVVSDKHLDLFVQTAFAGKKNGNLATPTGEQAPINTPEASRGTVSTTTSIPQPAENVNPQPQGADDGTRYALDEMSEEQYNSFGWASEADAMSGSELDDLHAKYKREKLCEHLSNLHAVKQL